jgi:hypothetical protein
MQITLVYTRETALSQPPENSTIRLPRLHQSAELACFRFTILRYHFRGGLSFHPFFQRSSARAVEFLRSYFYSGQHARRAFFYY